MNKNYLTNSYVDHYIQAEVIKKLVSTDRPVRFTELKEDGIENSLFMYHVNKLITRGIISKDDDGYTLSAKGARWANFAGVHHSFEILTPRPLIQFFITDENQQKMLVALRKGSLKQLINEYMLPGNVYAYGVALEENAKAILTEILGDPNITFSLLTIAEVIHKEKDEYVNHVISHIFTATAPSSGVVLSTSERYDLNWFDIQDTASRKEVFGVDSFLSMFLNKASELQPHETFIIT